MEIVTASVALPMTNGCPVIKDGAIAIEFNRIHAFGVAWELKKRFPGAEIKPHPGRVIMPGLINAHCHLDLVSFFESRHEGGEAIPEDMDFIDILTSSIDFKHDANPQMVIRGIQKGIDRLIETGVTCVGDMTHFEGTFKLLREAGLRAVVFPEILAGRGEAAQQKFEVALALLEKYTDDSGDQVKVGLGPYAPYLLSRNLLKIISQHAKEASIPLMIHAAESFAEMEFFFDSAGSIATEVFPSLGWKELPPAQRKTPLSYLAEIGFLEAPTTIIGAMHLAHSDFPLLARHLSRVVWCPTTNQLMKHGVFPYGKLIQHGIPVGLGTENWHSPAAFNLWNEIRLATDPQIAPAPTPKEALHMATVGSARALGLDHLVGTLEEGKRADYIVIHAGGLPDTDTDDELYRRLIAHTEPHHIEVVVVGGNILKSI